MATPQQSDSPGLSIVVPMRNEAPVIDDLLGRLEEVFGGVEGGWEMIAVDDGSTDATWRLLKEASAGRAWLKGVRFEGPSGQHPAIIAGLRAARGKTLMTMDADLQVFPEDMLVLLKEVEEGADIAFGIRDHAGEGFLRRRVGPALNRFFARHSTGSPQNALSTFFAARRMVVEVAFVFLKKRPNVPFQLMLGAPKRVVWVPVRNALRARGESKYGLARLLCLTVDIFFGYCKAAWNALYVTALVTSLGILALWLSAAFCLVAGRRGLFSDFLTAGLLFAAVFVPLTWVLLWPAKRRSGLLLGAPLYHVKETF